MDPRGNIYESDDVPPEDRARLEGFLRGMMAEHDELDGGFVAECIDLPGAMAQGETGEEALEELSEAIQGIVAVKKERRLRDQALYGFSAEKDGVRVDPAELCRSSGSAQA